MKMASLLRRPLGLYKKWIGFACLVLILQSLLVVVLPLPLRFLVDHVFPHSQNEMISVPILNLTTTAGTVLMLALTAIAFMAILKFGFDFLEEYLTATCATKVSTYVKDHLNAKLLKIKYGHLSQFKGVDLLGRISHDSSNLELLVGSSLTVAVRALPTLFAVLTMMFVVSPQFSLVLLIMIPAIYFLTKRISQSIQKGYKLYRSSVNRFDLETHQMISALPLVKSLSAERKVLGQLFQRSAEIEENLLKARAAQGWLTAGLNGTRNAVWVSILGIGGFAIFQNIVSLGDLILFMAYMETLAKPINEVSKFASKYSKAKASLDRVTEFDQKLDTCLEVEDSQQADIYLAEPLTFEFHKVGFLYEPGIDVLKDISFSCNAGELIAIVGASGSGKSTLIKLFNRLLSSTAGSILLNNQPIENYPVSQLRQIVTVISQEDFILSGTVRENLTLGIQRNIPDAALWEALTRANASGFVHQLKKGLDHKIGEGHRSLSGGQKKRINLARGFLRSQSQVLVFDEPTSGLDPISSKIVTQNLRRFAEKNRLVIWVTHDLRSASMADQIFYFNENSQLVVGQHEKLLEVYKEYHDYNAGDGL